jgi:hypothetical protein
VLAYLITGDPEPGRRSLTRIFSNKHIANRKASRTRRKRTAK